MIRFKWHEKKTGRVYIDCLSCLFRNVLTLIILYSQFARRGPMVIIEELYVNTGIQKHNKNHRQFNMLIDNEFQGQLFHENGLAENLRQFC